MSERKLGNAGPWGVTAFASTSFVLGFYNAGLVPHAGIPILLAMALIFGGAMQVICGILEIVAGNTFVGRFLGHMVLCGSSSVHFNCGSRR